MAGRKRRGREEGSVYQRADGTWCGAISMGYDGADKRRRRVVYGKTKQEAQTKLRELQTAADRGQLPTANRLTVGQFLKTWLDAVKPTVADNTLIAYERDVNNAVLPHLGGVRLDALTALHVQRMYIDLAKAGTSAAMQRKAGVTLSAALGYAVKIGLVPHNVAKDVKKPRHTPKEQRSLDPAQARAFLAEARSDRLFALYAFLIDSGAREYEAFGLKWSDVHWETSSVQIVRGLDEVRGVLKLKELKTKKSRRRVILTATTARALARHREAMRTEGRGVGPDDPVFCDTEGGWLRKSNVLRRSFRPILERAGLPPIRPYDLRHSSASLLMHAGEDPKVVSERLGHSTPRLTLEVYAHVLAGMQERAAARLESIFAEPS